MFSEILLSILLPNILVQAAKLKAQGLNVISHENELFAQVTGENTREVEVALLEYQRQEGDIVGPMPPLGKSGLVDPEFRWPGGDIFYELDEDLPTNLKSAFLSAISHISGRTCVTFKERSREPDYIWVTSGTDCMTSLGRVGGRQLLVLNEVQCGLWGQVVHELVHVIGFGHENNRYDRDDYLTIKLENVDPENRRYFNKYDQVQSSPFSVPYDFSSVTHYSAKDYSTNGLDTVVPKQLKAIIGQRSGLSDLDIRKVNNMYCNSVVGFRIKSLQNGLYLDVKGGQAGEGRPVVAERFNDTRQSQRWTADLSDLMDETKGGRLVNWAQDGGAVKVLTESNKTSTIFTSGFDENSARQLWTIVETSSSKASTSSADVQTFLLKNIGSGKCLRLPPVRCSGLTLVEFLVKKFLYKGQCYKDVALTATTCDTNDPKQSFQFMFLLQ